MERDRALAHDLFVSHAEEDRSWVLGFFLPALGLPRERVVTSGDLVPGRGRIAEIVRAVESSRYTVAVLSRSYLADDWSVLTDELASHLSVASGPDGNRIIPLRREPTVEVPLHLGFRIWLDCADPERANEEIGRLRELLGTAGPGPEEAPPECPYPGMVPFTASQSELFHGRETEIERLLDLISTHNRLFVIGPSGSGKSSLLQAGLLPRLGAGLADRRRSWRVLQIRPGQKPAEVILAALRASSEADISDAVDRILAREPPAEKLLLVVDPLEEVFTLGDNESRDGLCRVLRELRCGRCTILLAVRADFYAELMKPDFWPLLGPDQRFLFPVAPLAGEALRAAIEKPAEAVGVYVERALADQVISEAAREPGALPMVQETLRRIWRRQWGSEWRGRTWRLLPLALYESLGQKDGRTGLQVALADHADAALGGLSTERQALARRIFLRLVQFGEGRPDTRRQQTVKSLLGDTDDPGEVRAVIQHLVERRLLTPAERDGEKAVDLCHETLIVGWPTLQSWLTDLRLAEQRRRLLVEKVAEWNRLEHRGGLLDEVELREATQWLESPESRVLGSVAGLKDLVQASHAILEREEKRRKLRIVLLWGAVAVLLAALLATGLFWNRERLQRRVSLVQALAARANRLIAQERDPELAGLLAVQSYRLLKKNQGEAHLPQVDEVLRSVLADKDFSTGLDAGIEVSDMALSGDGRLLAASGPGGALRVWDLARPGTPPRVLKSGTGQVNKTGEGRVFVSFHPSQPLLAAMGDDGIRLWDFAEAQPRVQLLTDRSVFRGGILFSSDGGRLFFLGRGGTANIWDVKRGTERTLPSGDSEEWIGRLSLSGDGKRLVGVGDNVLLVWDTEHLDRRPRTFAFDGTELGARLDLAVDSGGARVATLRLGSIVLNDLAQPGEEPVSLPIPGQPNSVAFSPDGQTLAAGNLDGDIFLWDLKALKPEQKPRVLRGHGQNVRVLRFDRQSRWLISGSFDRTVRRWNLTQRAEEPQVFFGRDKEVSSLAFTPDGAALAFSGVGGLRFQLLGGSPAVFPPIEMGEVSSIAFDLHRGALALAASGVVVLVPDPHSPNNRSELPVGAPVSDIAFHPDGTVLAWAGERTVDVHRIGGPPTYLSVRVKHLFYPLSLAFDPDGEALAVASYEGVFLWPSFRHGTEAGQPLRLPSPVRSWYATEISPEGRWLAAGGGSGALGLWEMDHPTDEPRLLVGPRGSVWAVAFDREHRLASAGQDGIVRLWDLHRPDDEPVALHGGGRPLKTVAFSPDGSLVAAAGEDGLLRVWTVSTETLVDRVCALARRNLSLDEWRLYVGGDVEYELTCPELPSGAGVN